MSSEDDAAIVNLLEGNNAEASEVQEQPLAQDNQASEIEEEIEEVNDMLFTQHQPVIGRLPMSKYNFAQRHADLNNYSNDFYSVFPS